MSDRFISDEVIRVHLENPQEITGVGDKEEFEPEHFSLSTVVVSTAAPYNKIEKVLALDPLRKDFSIVSLDGTIVLCHSLAQANSAANQVANVPFPEGAVLGQNAALTGTGTGQMWAVATGATPCRVGIFINRRDR
jgi:hypothetical protein